MSNKAVIEQQTIIVHHNNQTSKEIFVMDNYNQDSICLDNYLQKKKSNKSFFESDLELLLFVIKTAKKEKIEAINEILHYVHDHQSGIEIEGKYYKWEKIKSIFKKTKFNI